jgi:hypothetical protein
MKASERDSLLTQILPLLVREDNPKRRYEIVSMAESLVSAEYRIMSFNGVSKKVSAWYEQTKVEAKNE